MIKGVFGLPRSGKTTYLAKLAKQAIKKGRKVYTNFYCKGCYTLDFDSLGVCDYSDCLILIDEISLFCDCRSFKNYSDNHKYFFALHAHYNCDIVYCSQSYMDCDKKIRNVTDSLYQITPWYFGTSRVRPIQKQFIIERGSISEFYEVKGFGSLVCRRRYYSMFDSFERKQLPPNNERLWNDNPEKTEKKQYKPPCVITTKNQ